jgi:hypothetical protein
MMDIHKKIVAYHNGVLGDQHHRYRSWEHCYRFFRHKSQTDIIVERENAALQLGFYLASWGMYRGSSFLLQHAYTVHLGVVERLASPKFSLLWGKDLGSEAKDSQLIPIIFAAVEAVRESYRPFGEPTDTLVTKVLLGTLACLPACDRFFIDGFKRSGFQYSYLNLRFIERVFDFCYENIDALRQEQVRIETIGTIKYPLMKLVDMCFWQIGYEAAMEV